MRRSACLIFNPVAGQGDPEQDLVRIQELLSPELDLDIRLTSPDIGADVLAKEAVDRGVEMIIASGGDGTLSTAAAALVGTGIPCGIISRGTANAFANAMDIPDTIDAACETILGGKTRVVDAAMCNGMPMVLLMGIGFEAEVVEKADRQAKNRFGILAYVLAGLQQLREMNRFNVEIETEDKVVQVEAAAVTIANAAPPTSILAQGPAGLEVDDGMLDITIVAPTNRASAIAASYHLLQTALNSNAVERDDIGYLRARKVRVVADPPQKVVVDGELFGETPIEIECVPASLTLLVPSVEEENLAEKLEGLPGLVVIDKAEPALEAAE